MATTSVKQSSRLPSTRETRPALIGLAVLLIVGGALASAYLAIQSGHRADFVQVVQDVAPGAQITQESLGTVSLPEDFRGGYRVSDEKALIGKSATTRLLTGSVLTRAMVSDEQGLKAGQTQLTLPVDSSPFISNLRPGSQLALAVGSSATGDSRRTVLAELVSVGQASSGGGIGGAGGNQVPIVVSLDISCLPVVSQGIQDKTVTPALIGSPEGSQVQTTCTGG